MQAFRAAVALAPDRAQIWYFLGDQFLHYRAGLTDDHLETAESYFQEALRLDPRHGAAATHLGQIYERNGDDEALARTNALLATLDTSAVTLTSVRLWQSQIVDDTAGYGAAFADVMASGDLVTFGWATWPVSSIYYARDTAFIADAVEAVEEILTLPLTGAENRNGHLWAYRLYQIVGRPQRAAEVLARLEGDRPRLQSDTTPQDA